MYKSNLDNGSETGKKGCKPSCCSCSCLLIVILFILICISLVYAAYYWCWNIDNRIIEKLKSGEINSKNCYKYFKTTIINHFNLKKGKKLDNTYSNYENDSIDNEYLEEKSNEGSDFNEVDYLEKTNEIRKNLDKALKDKLRNNNYKFSDKDIPDNSDVINNTNVYVNNSNSDTSKKKLNEYDYLDLTENELLEKISNNFEENLVILKVALDKDFGKVLVKLIEKDSNIANVEIEEKSLLFYTAEKSSIKCRNYLINNGAYLKTEYQGKNLLHIAAHKGDLALAKLGLSIGLPVNKPTDIGYTPFYFSVMSNNLNMVKYLVKNGAKVDKNLKYLAKSREIYDYIDSFE